MPFHDDGCLPEVPRARRRPSSPLVLIIILLGMLMSYSIVLLALGFDPKVLAGVTLAVCGLAVRVVRRLVAGGTPPAAFSLTESGDL